MSDFLAIFYDLKAKAEQSRSASNIICTFTYDFYIKTRPFLKDLICLDIGIGNGWALRSMLSDGCQHCDGIDISKERLEQTRTQLQADGYRNFDLSLCNAENLTCCPSNHYDFVNYLDILEHLPDYIRGMKEVYRVLKPGGMAYIKTPNNFTDTDLALHHYAHLLLTMLLPGEIAPPGDNHLMLQNDLQRLSEEEQETLINSAPENFHEHIHQFYPDELKNFLVECDFQVLKLTGIPLFTDIIFSHESHLKNLAQAYTAFLKTPAYEIFVRALLEDILASGTRPSFIGLPADYVLSDNLVAIVLKPESKRSFHS